MMSENNTVTSGIKTREYLSDEIYGYIVEWIEWDSDFRNSGLQYADIIIAVNGKAYRKESRAEDQPRALGNYLESTMWAEHNMHHGMSITLSIYREGENLSITGNLQAQKKYFNSQNRSSIGFDGPERLSKDIFSSAWVSWYEKFMRHVTLYLDDKRWERSTLDNRKLVGEHLEWKPRVDYLQQNYPGRFAASVLSDWEKTSKILEGITYTDITDADLEYRKIGEQRVVQIKDAAQKGRTEFTAKIAANTIPAFPAMDPVHGEVLDVAGKIVVLPTISFEQFMNDLGKSFAVIGTQKDGFYFIHLNSKEMDIFFKTLFHYQAQVVPELPEKYQFFAEILNEPAILSYEGRAVSGLMVKVLAGMAGDEHVFIGISKTNKNGRAFFEGEEVLSMFSGYPLDDSATPKQVIEAMIHYIKMGDMNAWKNLFSSWQIYSYGEGLVFVDMAYLHSEEQFQHRWSQSRKQILDEIYDARVLHVGSIKTVITANVENAIPQVEQVKVIVDHIGKIEGRYKSLSNLYVHRKWILQRLNGGPWKIVELQAL